MVEKDLKRLIDALEERVKVLEMQLAFAQQENDRLTNEIVNLRIAAPAYVNPSAYAR